MTVLGLTLAPQAAQAACFLGGLQVDPSVTAGPYNYVGLPGGVVLTDPAPGGSPTPPVRVEADDSGHLTYINNDALIGSGDGGPLLSLVGTDTGDVCYDGTGTLALTVGNTPSADALFLANFGGGTVNAFIRNTVTSAFASGVFALTDGGDIAILVDSTGEVVGSDGGILGVNLGDTGNVTIVTLAGSQVTAQGGTTPFFAFSPFLPGAPIGIYAERTAFTTGEGLITISAQGNITSDGVGIMAEMCGCTNGIIDITTGGTIDALAGVVVNNDEGEARITVSGGVIDADIAGVVVFDATKATITIASGATVRAPTGIRIVNPDTSSLLVIGGKLEGTTPLGAAAILGDANDIVRLEGGYEVVGTIQAALGTDTLEFAGAAAGAFDLDRVGDDFLGFEAFGKSGTSTWTLTGTGAFSAPGIASGGKLVLNGQLTVPTLTLGSNATLGGTGTLVGDLIVNGTITPGNSIGVLTVKGDTTFGAASTYEVEINPGAADRTVVTGVATINGGTVSVLGASGTYASPTTYTILTATGGVAGTFDAVTDDLAFYTATLSYDPNTVFLIIERNATDVGDMGLTPNQRATGRGLDGMGTDAPYLDDILKLTEAQVPPMLDALSGEVHASLKGVLIDDSRYVREATIDRVQQAFDALDATPSAYAATAETAALGDDLEPAIWGRAFGGMGTIDTDGNAAEVSHSTGGMVIGADGLLGDWRLGLLATFGQTGATIPDRQSDADATNLGVGIYGGTEWDDISLSFGASYVRHLISTHRTAEFPGVLDTYDAEYGASTSQIFGEVAKEFDFGEVSLTPFGNLAYVNVATDAFQETGTGPGALHAAASSMDALFTTIGLRASTEFVLGDGMLVTLSASAGWRHAFADLPTSNNSFTGGSPFPILGAPLATDSLALEAGLELDISKTTSLTFGYSGQIDSAAQVHSGTATFALKF